MSLCILLPGVRVAGCCPPTLVPRLSCTGWGRYQDFHSKLSTSIKQIFPFVLATTTKTAARQHSPTNFFYPASRPYSKSKIYVPIILMSLVVVCSYF
ncbi:hypothetical protein CY34DRAFT_807655 [Suillus luteus UH-Slu-Lm8-n1]|uniref:Uncharacterized protein n=1 Tax=Suillus luteus UH-Slu-Lm8-n1 TaxID=930992 RepID=A0A0D0B0D7_9AGAM|nr:hypothetical protein CY34DRAFT_807655 [Suillus luteus UH-Slu-Lm8-n1]